MYQNLKYFTKVIYLVVILLVEFSVSITEMSSKLLKNKVRSILIKSN